jgi:3-oxoacyl-[acyl-carrier protein] reductase
MKLKNKTAIITGGARGIGKATAKLFLEEGANVVIFDISRALLDEFENSFLNFKENIKTYQVDVTSHKDTKEKIEEAIKHFNKIDIMICNAGITKDSMAHKMSEEQFDQVINVNLKGVFNCVSGIINHFRDNSYGKFVFTASVVGEYGNIGQLNYSATKSALITMAKTLSKELGRKNITVNVVSPGYTNTEMMSTVPEKVLQSIKDKTPMARLAEPLEIAKAFLFLSSDDSSFVTGHNLSVNGGLTL